jgi:glycosyltransferase involved in cell wall biosynthesis
MRRHYGCGLRGSDAHPLFTGSTNEMEICDGASLTSRDTPDDRYVQLLMASDLFEIDYYLAQVPSLVGLNREALVWHFLDVGEHDGLSPTPLYDANFYGRTYLDLCAAASLFAHFVEFGFDEGRHGTLASFLIAEGLDKVAIIDGLVPDPGCGRDSSNYLRALIDAVREGEVSGTYFSSEIYVRMYPDLRKAATPPLVHYLKYGRDEGRRSNVDLLNAITFNDRAAQPGRPFIMIGVHECSRTGAPRVGLDLALALRERFNVIFVTLEDGPLLPIARYFFPVTIIASKNPAEALFIEQTLSSICPFDRAIFSSVACEPFMRGLAETDISLTCLVHEFRENYAWAERSVVSYCDLLVFSSRRLMASWDNLMMDVGRSRERSLILPQPQSGGSRRLYDRMSAKAEVERLLEIDLKGSALVLAAGLVQIRKGTDFFLQIGTDLGQLPQPYKSIWIGKQVDEADESYGMWLHTHIEQSKDASGNPSVLFVPAGPLYDLLMDAADVFVVPSRLDPLPNVALDAASRSTPVVAFKGATGLADVAEMGRLDLTEVDYGSVGQMVRAIVRLTAREQGHEAERAAVSKAAPSAEAWTFDEYARRIVEGAVGLDGHRFDADDLAVDTDYVGPIMRTRFDRFNGPHERVSTTRLCRRMLRLGIATANPRPGIHSSRGADGTLTSYRSVWCQERKIENWPANAVMHIHAFYTDVLGDIFSCFSERARDARLIITVPTEEKAAEVQEVAGQWQFSNVEVVVVGNRGRDIGPFIDELASRCGQNDVVCHIHTKKSLASGDHFGRFWRQNMFRSILSQPAIDLFEDRNIGLVFPDNPRNNGWGKNYKHAEAIAGNWGKSLPYHPGPFPIGNMFWVRGSVLQKMRQATAGIEWPKEPVPVDGTVLHAIERLWSMACREAGLEIAAVHARVRDLEIKQAEPEKRGQGFEAQEENALRRQRMLAALAGEV